MGSRLLGAALAILLLCPAVAARAENVNRIQLDSAPTGENPTIAPVGPDTNLGLVLLPKGAGGVGISTYTPQDKLEIYAWGNANIRFNNGAIGGAQGLDWYIAGAQRGWLRLNGASGNLEIANKWNPYAITFSTGVTPSERLRIEASGNVGIGTTSPSSTLEIVGAASTPGLKVKAANSGAEMALNTLAAGQTFGMLWQDNGTTKWQIFKNGGNAFGVYDYVGARNALVIAPNGNMQLMPAGGNIGIGTASPAATLDVNGYAKLAKNTSAPVACSSTTEGSIAYTGGTTNYLCFCNGSTWQQAHSPSSACTW